MIGWIFCWRGPLKVSSMLIGLKQKFDPSVVFSPCWMIYPSGFFRDCYLWWVGFVPFSSKKVVARGLLTDWCLLRKSETEKILQSEFRNFKAAVTRTRKTEYPRNNFHFYSFVQFYRRFENIEYDGLHDGLGVHMDSVQKFLPSVPIFSINFSLHNHLI